MKDGAPASKTRLVIRGYGCTSSAGPTAGHFFAALKEQADRSRALPEPGARACLWERDWGVSRRELLVTQLLEAAAQAGPPRGRLGLLLASTKGEIDDWVWERDGDRDPYTGIIEEFIARSARRPERWLTVSNACASSLSAVWLARRWLAAGMVDQCLLLAADAVGPFVLRGFGCLRALTSERCRPFDAKRSGLQLGEAAAAILLAGDGEGPVIDGIGIDAEGFAATRPSAAGESLLRACGPMAAPDLIIAHGTGTPINDAGEDRVFFELFGAQGPRITATKGAIGHTLGASGAMDLIAGCEAIRRGEDFGITGLREADPEFHGNYVLRGAGRPIASVLVTSLGFGGIHAAARISR